MSALKKVLLKWITAWRQSNCSHVFDLDDMGHRDHPDGTLNWACWRCGKVFTEHCGLDVLRHGKPQDRQKDKSP